MGKRILDFDEVCEAPMEFRLLGKDRKILPISLEKYAAYVNEFAELNTADNTGGVDGLAEKWHHYLSQFIEPLELEEIKRMSIAQIAMCFSAIVRRVQGETAKSIADIDETNLSEEEVKKKSKLREIKQPRFH